MSGGSVEKQTGTTDLEKLGGLVKNMPLTFVFFSITALSISGVPPFNGFFSKELIYGSSLERGTIFYIAAVVGTFFTAASFLKLGHAAYLGSRSEANREVREASVPMLVPMLCLSLICIFLGLCSGWPIKVLFEPVLGQERLAGFHHEPISWISPLVLVTTTVLVSALLNHIYGVLRTKRALGACDHIHYAPVLSWFYDKAEKKYFDPYEIWSKIVRVFSAISSALDRAIDRFYNDLVPRFAEDLADLVKRAHTGSYRLYIIWSIAALSAILIFLIKAAAGGAK